MSFSNEEALAVLNQAGGIPTEISEESNEPIKEEVNETPEQEVQEEVSEPTRAEQTETRPNVDVTQPPQIDHEALAKAIAEGLSRANQANQHEPQMSEEDIQKEHARQALIKELGLDSVLQQNEQLKADLEMLKQAHTKAEAEKVQAQLARDIQAFKGEYHESAESEVLKHLQGLPPQMASVLDNPQGWRLIADAKGLKKPAQGSAPSVKPDPIVSSNNSTVDATDGMSKLRNGQMQGVDAGNFIMNLAGIR